jgi:GntR family transcriptional regulator, transcriptional repressor for pyruvate dehydrogenase complex
MHPVISTNARSKASISEKIAHQLERAILKGSLKAGDRLPTEETLTRQHSTSRPIVREAMRALKGKGLIVTRRGSGSYVADNASVAPLRASVERYGALRGDTRAYEDLLELRLIVETHCIRALARQDAAEARKRLAMRLKRMETLQHDLERFGSADLAFHLEIVASAGNTLITTIYEGLLPGIGERFARDTYHDTGQTAITLREHRAILRAVESLDEERAADALRRHLHHSRRHFRELIGSPPA